MIEALKYVQELNTPRNRTRLAAALALVAGMKLALPVAAAPGCQVFPVGNKTNVRSAPTIDGDILATITQNNPGIVVAEGIPDQVDATKSWIQINNGFVRTDVVKQGCHGDGTAEGSVNGEFIPYAESYDDDNELLPVPHDEGGALAEVLYYTNINGQRISLYLGGTLFNNQGRAYAGPGKFITELGMGDQFMFKNQNCTVIEILPPFDRSPGSLPPVITMMRASTGNIALATSTDASGNAKQGVIASCA